MARTHRTELGVNVDHVATIRQARETRYPDPITAAAISELAGADQITVHLREDRRHIIDRDLTILRQTIQTRMNLEMAATEEMLNIALTVQPDTVTLVPEKREEKTTEGGLDVVRLYAALAPFIEALKDGGIETSLFIDPDPAQIETSTRLGVDIVELHTGDYAEADNDEASGTELARIEQAAALAADAGLYVAAGHGLDYVNVREVAALEHVAELNIGHAIVARAIFVGMDQAVREMVALIRESE